VREGFDSTALNELRLMVGNELGFGAGNDFAFLVMLVDLTLGAGLGAGFRERAASFGASIGASRSSSSSDDSATLFSD
jgi:hypothetical protein